MQVNPERFGIDASSHDPSYNLIFSETFLETTGFDLNDFCYYFERPFENSPQLHRRYIQLEGLVRAWKTALKERAVHLVYHEHDAGMTILDTRESEERSHTLDPIESLIYKELAEPIRIDRLQARFADRITGERFEGIMTTLNDKGLVFIEAEKILALAIPNGSLTPP
ncbi:MAG: hypothetical protein HQL97_15600 [Magnetococcales bacterium]|nr:hypothetical protein [Magnetococcales bacterium]